MNSSVTSQNQKGNDLETNQEGKIKSLTQKQYETLQNIPSSQKKLMNHLGLEENHQESIMDPVFYEKGNTVDFEANRQENLKKLAQCQEYTLKKNAFSQKDHEECQADVIKDPAFYQQSSTLNLETNQSCTLKNAAFQRSGSIMNLETNFQRGTSQNEEDTQKFIPSCQKINQQEYFKAVSQYESIKDTSPFYKSQKEGKNNKNDFALNQSNSTKDLQSSQQAKMFDLALEIANQTEKYFSIPVVLEILLLLQEQQPEYQSIKYLGHSELTLVLQASKSEQGNVALKISKYNSTSKIDLKKKETILKSGAESEYCVKVNQILYLCEQNEQQKEIQSSNHDDNYRYAIVEMELCQSNLKKYLQYLKDSKIILSQIEKEILGVQIIDSINFLHSKNVLHRDIKPENFLVQQNQSKIIPVLLKLSGLGQASMMLEKKQKSKKGTSNYLFEEALNESCKKESDLFSVGIVLLELDNYDTLDYSKLSILECLRKEGIEAFKSESLNTKSLIFEASKILLNPEQRKRSSAKEILAKFLAQKECQNVPLYSVIDQSKIDSFVMNSTRTADMIKKQKNKLPPQFSIDQIRRAVALLYKKKTFSLFSFQGFCYSGVTFSVINLKHNREVVIKISLVSNRLSILRQIEAMNKCRSPYIVNFSSYEFFKDENNTEYVVFEFDQCSCTLTYYLNLQTPQKQYPQEIKERLALSIIDSIALLHRQNVLHGDIKLEDFLIQEDEEGRVVAKLANFGSSGLLNSDYRFDELYYKGELKEQSNCLYLEGGSLEYLSPERYHTPKNPTTKLSDGFSVGICLLLLDNYLSFSNEFCSNYFQLLSAYEKPFKNCFHLFNLESKIFQWALLLLEFDPQKRSFPSEIIDQMVNSPTPLYSKWNNKLPLQKEYLEAPCLFLRLKLQDIEIQNFEFFSSISTSLSSLKLDLGDNQLVNIEVGNLLKSISSLSSLSSLEIQLSSNQIGNEGEENIFSYLSSLTSLQSLKLDLNNNQLTSIEVGNLLKSIQSLSSLSSLEIDLQENQIGNEGEANISQDLSKLTSLSTLKLDLRNNQLTSIGVQNLLKSISTLFSLSSLEIQLSENYIENEGEANIFSYMSALTLLSSLKLSVNNNYLTNIRVGNLLKSIQSLFSLSSLEIDIQGNQIENEGEENIFSYLSSLIKLSQLKLNVSNNQLTSIGVGNLLKSISSLFSLSTLQIDLRRNQIGYEGEDNISQDLLQLTSLSALKLDLRNNQLTSIGFGNLLKSIQSLSSLSSFEMNLSENQIGIEGEENISQDLSSLSSLSQLKLNLTNNQLTSIGVGNLLKCISSLFSLSSLEIQLYDNQIGIEGEANISQDLSALTSLSTLKLDLRNNQLASIGVGNLLKSFSSLFSLSSLEIDLSENQIGEEGEQDIFQDLSALSSFSSLNLYVNNIQLTSIGVGNLLKSFSSLVSLLSLEIHLRRNQIGIDGEENIFQDMSALTSLCSLKLNLSNNQLTSIGVGNLLKSFSNLSSLSSLEIELYRNYIGNEGEADIFQYLSRLTSLYSLKLDLKYNQLTNIEVGKLLKSISSLFSLSSLEIDIHSNYLENEGEANIFSDLSALTSLSSLKLDLSNNQLTSIEVGNLLKSISSLFSLSSLSIHLSENQIGNEGEASIFSYLSALISLQSLKLDLNNNQLTSIEVGNLLKAISNIFSLSTLEIHLSENQIKKKEIINKFFSSQFNFVISKRLDL